MAFISSAIRRLPSSDTGERCAGASKPLRDPRQTGDLVSAVEPIEVDLATRREVADILGVMKEDQFLDVGDGALGSIPPHRSVYEQPTDSCIGLDG